MFFQRNPFLARWGFTTISVLVAAHIVNGISYDSFAALLVAALLLGILNAVLRPVLLLLSLPLLIASLGLFALVINAFLLYFVGLLVASFHVESFRAAFWGGVLVSLISMTANLMFGTRGSAIRVEHKKPPRRQNGDQGGSGPVIDI